MLSGNHLHVGDCLFFLAPLWASHLAFQMLRTARVLTLLRRQDQICNNESHLKSSRAHCSNEHCYSSRGNSKNRLQLQLLYCWQFLCHLLVKDALDNLTPFAKFCIQLLNAMVAGSIQLVRHLQVCCGQV